MGTTFDRKLVEISGAAKSYLDEVATTLKRTKVAVATEAMQLGLDAIVERTEGYRSKGLQHNGPGYGTVTKPYSAAVPERAARPASKLSRADRRRAAKVAARPGK